MKKQKNKRTFYSKFIKRFFDISISLVAILILSPILLILYILNCIFVGFPTIFKQQRPGKDNKLFSIYKFRSMNNKKDKNGNLLPDSQRITLWGKIMRKTSLDELPQLFCILFGKMSIIGFRPRLIKDAIFYDKNVFESYTERPGLTGPIQSTSRNENSWEEIFESDMAYNKKIRFADDIKIFFKTFVSVFKKSGESRDSAEEDKKSLRDYYYADYLLKTGKISKEQYDYGMELSKEIAKAKRPLEFHPEILNKDLFDKMKNHKHAIILISNKKGEFLQIFEESWNCWLFLNTKICGNVAAGEVENCLISSLGLGNDAIKASYQTNFVHEKFSVKDGKAKTYNHYFYKVTISNMPKEFLQKEFVFGGKKYSWRSLAELKSNKQIAKLNGDIISQVEKISK